jgi:hypothetical protein
MLGMGQGFAQSVPDPLVNIKFDKDTLYDVGLYGGATGMAAYNNGNAAYRRRCPKPTTFFDPVKGNYIGSKDNGYGDFFYLKYNEGDDLANAFLNQYTIEFLYSPQYADTYDFEKRKASNGKYYYYEYNYNYWRSPMGSWNGWGWFFQGLDAVRETDHFRFVVAATNANDYKKGTVDHAPGYDQTNLYCLSNLPQVPGKFYHVVATVDFKNSKKINLYVDGQMMGETDIPDTLTSKLPSLGAVDATDKLRKNMWICLGGMQNGYANNPKDPSTNVTYLYESSANQFVFARIYNEALSEDQAKSLYNDDVKYYTEQNEDLDKDMLMDVRFAKSGDATDASSLKADIVKVGTGADSIAYDATQKRNVATFIDEDFQLADGTAANEKYTQNFYYRDFKIDSKFKSHFTDGFSIEAYTKLNNAAPTHAMVPIGSLNYEQEGHRYFAPLNYEYKEFGTGYMISTTRRIGFNLNTIGWHDNGDGTGAWTIHEMLSTLKKNDYVGYSTDAGAASTDWQHVVMVYDRKGSYIGLYVNGVPVKEASIDSTEYLRFSSAAWQYFGIGADADFYNDPHTYGEWAFDGDMSICRIWSKSLTPDDIQSLYTEAKTPGTTVTLDKNGFGTLCVPYNFKVPAGLTAYVVSSQTGNTVEMTKFLESGGVVAYGTPVILVGAANTAYNIEPAPDDNATSPKVNLLYGTFVSKDVPAKHVYEVNSADQQMDMNIEEKTLAAHTAYLPVGTSTAAYKAFGSIITSIEVIDVKPETKVDNVYYDLSGRRVNKPSKGLYLQKGKKVLVK